ncbi:MAG: helix-turn-helix domain-containing protein [Candidatus Hydrogenedentes bacterium]|nr:helix-turn-helix domain-containing protein [Candidatus Hydrogenedentota bacterium]
MLKPAAFQDASVREVLERAATVAGMPLALHYVEGAQEGPKILGWRQCAVCAQVAGLPGGRQACRASRSTASRMAVEQERPVPFVCHMGLACVSVPAVAGQGYVLTFGPFAPKGQAASLAHETALGLRQFQEETDAPIAAVLDDLHETPLESVRALAEWTVSALAGVLAERGTPETLDEPSATPMPAPVRARQPRPVATGPSQGLAIAVAGGDLAALRMALQREMEQAGTRPTLRRAALLRCVSGVYEVLLQSGLVRNDTSTAFGEMTAALEGLEEEHRQLTSVIQFFKGLRRREVEQIGVLEGLEQLNGLITARFPEGITLNEAAAQIGETPSAITHRLQRKFGLSYTGYVAFRRIEMAKRLLLETTLTASEVGARVGIQDQSNFGKLFKKVEGMTPQQFRQNHRKGRAT